MRGGAGGTRLELAPKTRKRPVFHIKEPESDRGRAMLTSLLALPRRPHCPLENLRLQPGLPNLWITEVSENPVKAVDPPRPPGHICTHTQLCIGWGAGHRFSKTCLWSLDPSREPLTESVSQVCHRLGTRIPQRCQQGPPGLLGTHPLPPSNSGAPPSLSWTPSSPHTWKDLQRLG